MNEMFQYSGGNTGEENAEIMGVIWRVEPCEKERKRKQSRCGM